MSRRPGLYALLLKAYPREYSAAHSAELLATLEESSGGRVDAREAAGLLIGALRQRRLSDQVRRRRTTLMSAAWLAGLLLLGLSFAVGSALAVMDVRSGGLQSTPRELGGLLSGLVLALALRGRVRSALTLLLLALVPLSGLAVATGEPLPAVLSLVVPAIVLGVMSSARQPFAVTTYSWWWLAVPPLWGAGLMVSSSPIYLQVATLALVTLLAGGEARFALAAATAFLVMAADIMLSALARFSLYGDDLATAAAMTGIAVVLALLGSPVLARRLTPASPTA
jgi:hypothetical protein